MRPFDSRLVPRVAAVFAVALFGAVVAGIVVGAAVASVTLGGNTGDLSEFGDAMAAGAAGVLAAATVYVAITFIGVRRELPEGQRAAATAALLVAPLLLGAAGTALSFGGRSDVPVADPAAVYRRAAIPVALVDGTTLDAPAAGWRVASVEHAADLTNAPAALASTPARASVNWQVRSQIVKLQMIPQPPTAASACPDAIYAGACERIGVTPRGAAIWGRHLPPGSGPGYQSVWAVVDGGLWHLSVSGPVQAMDVAEAVQVLSRLQPVDVDHFLAVAANVVAI